MTDVSQEFRTGQRAHISGVYRYVRHTENVDCVPPPEEEQIPHARGEVFPPHRSCQSGVIWRLVVKA